MPNYFETVNLPLFAADFHYFRIPHDRWELMLTRLKQMGMTAVSLTIPWSFHESERGTVDLNGTINPRRDIAGLIDLCQAFNFSCILQLGPYTQAGVLGDGLPAWLLKGQGDVEAAVAGWYKAISRALSSQQWPAGPIVALEVKSEAGETTSPDYAEELSEVKWPIWLRKHYHGIEALNAAYGTDYRTVSEVKFPRGWSTEPTPLEKDAQEFLAEVRGATRANSHQILLEAGWQVPIYPAAGDISAQLPPIQNYTSLESDPLPALSSAQPILNLQQPIQVEPDPTDVGGGPVWAAGAPIRADGSLRPKFWQLRRSLWQQTFPEAKLEGNTLILPFNGGSLVTSPGDTLLKIETTPRTKATAYRLRMNGEVVADDNLKVTRGKVSGAYLAADEVGQTDLIFFLNDPAAPLADFLSTYLRNLLTGQSQTLAHGAALAADLSQALALPPGKTSAAAPARPVLTSYTLEQARRGLSEAEAALRKAMTSIGELESGFSTILGKSGSANVPQPAAASLAISPEILEGPARDMLLEAGATCAKVASQLKAAAADLQRVIDTPGHLTLEQYRQSYETAVAAAHVTREPLLKLITQLRLEIASERLPLLAWRIHNQLQEMAESLRRGVLRG